MQINPFKMHNWDKNPTDLWATDLRAEWLSLICKKSAVVALKSVWRIPEDSRVWSATANTTSVRIAKLGKGQAATQASAKAKRQAHKGSERKGKKGQASHKRARRQRGKHTRAASAKAKTPSSHKDVRYTISCSFIVRDFFVSNFHYFASFLLVCLLLCSFLTLCVPFAL